MIKKGDIVLFESDFLNETEDYLYVTYSGYKFCKTFAINTNFYDLEPILDVLENYRVVTKIFRD